MIRAVERWLPVSGFNDCYQVSTEGRVRSLDRRTSNGVLIAGRVLRLHLVNGYHAANLTRGSKRQKRYVHMMAANAFFGPPPTGWETLHKNGVRSDSRLCNLMHGTRSMNMADRKRHAAGAKARV